MYIPNPKTALAERLACSLPIHKRHPSGIPLSGSSLEESTHTQSKPIPNGTRAHRMDRKRVGMAERTALIRTKLPPRDSIQALHPSSRCSTFSITSYQSCFQTRPTDRGMPRYLMGRYSHSVARIAEHRAVSSSSIPKVTSVDLSQLRQRPKKSEKISSIANTFFAASEVPLSKNIVSSAYWRSGIPC